MSNRRSSLSMRAPACSENGSHASCSKSEALSMRGVDTDTGTLELRITGILGSSCSVALSQTLSALTDGVVAATMKFRAAGMSASLLRKTYTNNRYY